MAEYINISSSNSRGVTSVSYLAICQMVNYVLEDVGYIVLDDKDNEDKNKIAKLTEPVSTLIKNNLISIKVCLSFKKDSNATKICQELQKEIFDNVISMTEYSNINVDIKICGIY